MELHLTTDNKSINFYTNHSFIDGNCGLELFFVEDTIIPAYETVLIDLHICAELRSMISQISFGNKNKLFTKRCMLIFATSNLYKTPLRLSNSIELVNSCNNVKVAFDNISDSDYVISRGDSYVQLVSPNFEQFNLIIKN